MFVSSFEKYFMTSIIKISQLKADAEMPTNEEKYQTFRRNFIDRTINIKIYTSNNND